MDSTDPLQHYRSQIATSIDTFDKSITSWQARKKLYKKLLDTWQPYDQLRKNPVDTLRLQFIEEEISKQEKKLKVCKESLTKFEILEKQLKDLARAAPIPSSNESEIATDETFMEIREELDDDDNIISSTVVPQSASHLHDIDATMKGSSIATVDAAQQTKSISDTDRPWEVPQQGVSASSSVRDSKNVAGSHAISVIDNLSSAQEEESEQTAGAYQAEGTFGIRETADGQIEITDDPNGFSIGIVPDGLAEMTSIVNETDWGKDLLEDEQEGSIEEPESTRHVDGDEDEEEEEDEYGRVKHRGMVPLPGILSRPSSSQEMREHLVEHHRRNSADPDTIPISSARSKQKKKLVFADKLVQGPSAGSSKSPAKPVLKKESAYPITSETEDAASPPTVPTIFEPKQSRFKLERSSTDTMITKRLHAQPSQAFEEKLKSPVARDIVERATPSDDSAKKSSSNAKNVEKLDAEVKPTAIGSEPTNEERSRLYPNKINLAGFDLNPEDGLTKAPLSIPKLSEEEMAAIRRKREAMGKKHRRRKSADPNYPIRSGSWDESQPLQKLQRRPSTGELDAPSESMKTARLDRAVEILKAQEDIAWANAPITPEEVTPDTHSEVHADPLAEAGQKETLEKDNDHENARYPTERPSLDKEPDISTKRPAQAPPEDIPKAQEPTNLSGILSPVPRKPPTPERSSSFTNIPSPLRQEIQPSSTSKEVQFTSDIIKRLEPLAESDSEFTIIARDRRAPPRQPSRQSSIDPQVLSPTPHSPPPEQRCPGPLGTEEEGSVSHYMVRATSKSPPPHIAIHDLIGDTPEAVRLAMKEEALTPTPNTMEFGSDRYDREVDPMDMARNADIQDIRPTKMTNSTNGIVEHIYSPRPKDDKEDATEEEIDDELHRKEIALEYHRLRARMIGREGGYVKEEEGEIVPLDTPESQPTERISRFKAARLGQKST